MIVDSSALLAMLLQEADAEAFDTVIARASYCGLSAANYLETSIILDSCAGSAAAEQFDRYLSVAGITIEPVTYDQVAIARQAYRTYGKGNHKASLNFGDCFAYALAKVKGCPLLFKGNDFSKTDIEAAV